MTAEQVTLLLKMQADLRGALDWQREMKRLDGSAVALTAKVGELARGLAGIFGLGLSAGGAMALVRGSTQLAASIKNLAAESQIGTQAFQALSALAAENGVRQEQLSAALVTLRRNLQEAAANGANPLNKELKALGLSAVGLQALAPERQFELIGKAILGAKDQAAAYNAAMDLFGRQNAPKLLTTLQALAREGFGAVAERTKELQLTPRQLDDLDRAGNALERMATSLKVFGARAVNGALSPTGFVGSMIGGTVSGLSDDPRERLRLAEERLAAAQAEGKTFLAAQEQARVDRYRALVAIGGYSGRGMTPADVERANLEAQMKAAEEKAKAARDAEEALKAENEMIAASTKAYSELLRGRLNAEADNGQKVREQRAKDAAAERQRAARAAVEAADLLLTATRNELAAMEANPFRSNREKAEQRVRILQRENEQLQAQIELNRQLAEQNPDQAATLLGQNRNLSERITDNTLAIGQSTPVAGAGNSLRAGLVDAENGILSVGENIRRTFSDTIGAGISAATNGLQALIGNTEYWTQRLGAVGPVIGAITQGISQMFVQWVTGRAIAAAKNIFFSKAEGAADAAAKGPGALLTSISSFGLAPVLGIAALVAAMASFGGFKAGGYTGDGGGSEIAGTVHRGEFVFPADVTAKLGPDTLQAMMNATRYESGAGRSALPAPASRRPARTVLVDHRDQDLVRRLENDPNYETSVVRIGRSNRYAIGAPS